MPSHSREVWIDAVKGLTIILVVFHHVFHGVQASIGFSDLTLEIYRLTSPIRMPLFFLVAGFFAKKSIDGSIHKFIDTKVAHFIYLYVLWSIISITIRSALSSFTHNDVSYLDILTIFWEPTFTIWFLYALLIAFVTARLTRGVPPIVQVIGALILGVIAQNVSEGSNILVKTAKLYPLFIIGVHYSYLIRNRVVNSSYVIFFIVTALYVAGALFAYQYSIKLTSYLYYVMAGFGVLSLMTAINILENVKPIFNTLQYVGKKSIYIYLMHFLPAAGARIILIKFGFNDPLLIVLLGTLISVLSCLVVCEVINRIKGANFLFQKPISFF
jgi:uncharacterized membrane protein YcfT